jgi:hypothetical protein
MGHLVSPHPGVLSQHLNLGSKTVSIKLEFSNFQLAFADFFVAIKVGYSL